jgi:succinyl-CoA synthetase beta subunit
MKIHEYQAKALLEEYGIPVNRGIMAENSDDISHAVKSLKPPFVIKAQIHSGGRGKAGGVKIANTTCEAVQISGDMLGKTLVTKQTGPKGRIVKKLLIAECVDIKKEYYVSMTLDSENSCIALVASGAGGVEIEETAAENPDSIIRRNIDINIGVRDYFLRNIASMLGVDDVAGFIRIGRGMFELFMEKDCSMVEINPLVETPERALIAIDAKVTFDDNALFRHPDIAGLCDINELDPKEAEAGKHSLNYIALNGSVGCMVNGAGLAMATMDIINAYGGKPANFLDVGGNTTGDSVAEAFKILLSDEKVRVIFVNIFGGIVKCDIIAEGIINAIKSLKSDCSMIDIPIVVRLAGNNSEKGNELLNKSGLNIISKTLMADAAKTCVLLSQESLK